MPQTVSPFRYPGGKSQLYPFIENLLRLNDIHGTYIETFAGGSAIGVKLLLSGKVDHIVINDYDASIYSVWNAILNHPDYLIKRIESVPFDYYHAGTDEINMNFWKAERQTYFTERADPDSLSGAFATLFLNRTNRSGIITGGPVGGWTQSRTKISARFNKKTLIKKIVAIHNKRDSITISNYDALKLIPTLTNVYDPDSSFIFFDPPYFEQGSNLYYSSLDQSDHASLATEILALQNFKWIVTYDHHPMIRDLYRTTTGKFDYRLNYSANKRLKAPEYLFSSSSTKIESFNKTQLNPIN